MSKREETRSFIAHRDYRRADQKFISVRMRINITDPPAQGLNDRAIPADLGSTSDVCLELGLPFKFPFVAGNPAKWRITAHNRDYKRHPQPEADSLVNIDLFTIYSPL